jgi:hypothetical protein
MKTIKLLSFFIVATVIFSSCDAIADSLSKEVDGTMNIDFTTTGEPLTAPDGLQKANNATNADIIIYNEPFQLSEVRDELKKYGLDIHNFRDLTITSATFTLPTTADAQKFAGAKILVYDQLLGQQEGSITSNTFNLVIKDQGVLFNTIRFWATSHVKITNPIQLPKGLDVKVKINYTGVLSPIRNPDLRDLEFPE